MLASLTSEIELPSQSFLVSTAERVVKVWFAWRDGRTLEVAARSRRVETLAVPLCGGAVMVLLQLELEYELELVPPDEKLMLTSGSMRLLLQQRFFLGIVEEIVRISQPHAEHPTRNSSEGHDSGCAESTGMGSALSVVEGLQATTTTFSSSADSRSMKTTAGPVAALSRLRRP